jgi:hypothetical protein
LGIGGEGSESNESPGKVEPLIKISVIDETAGQRHTETPDKRRMYKLFCQNKINYTTSIWRVNHRKTNEPEAVEAKGII